MTDWESVDKDLLKKFGLRVENGQLILPKASKETERLMKEYGQAQSFIQRAATESVGPEALREIRDAINKNGYWQSTEEWRISTLMSSRIDKCREETREWYQVTAKCGVEMSCKCSTVERAAQFVSVFRALIPLVVYNAGYPLDEQNRFGA